MDRYLSVTPVDQLRRQLCLRFYSMCYYMQPGVGKLTRKNGLTLNLHALSGYLVYFLNVILSHFYVFWTSKSQKKYPQKGSAMDSLEVLLHPQAPVTLHSVRVFHAHNLDLFSTTDDITFFSVSTPEN